MLLKVSKLLLSDEFQRNEAVVGDLFFPNLITNKTGNVVLGSSTDTGYQEIIFPAATQSGNG